MAVYLGTPLVLQRTTRNYYTSTAYVTIKHSRYVHEPGSRMSPTSPHMCRRHAAYRAYQYCTPGTEWISCSFIKDRPLSHSVSADFVGQWFILYKRTKKVLWTQCFKKKNHSYLEENPGAEWGLDQLRRKLSVGIEPRTSTVCL